MNDRLVVILVICFIGATVLAGMAAFTVLVARGVAPQDAVTLSNLASAGLGSLGTLLATAATRPKEGPE